MSCGRNSGKLIKLRRPTEIQTEINGMEDYDQQTTADMNMNEWMFTI